MATGNATELLIAADVAALLQAEGCIDASENFVQAKFQDIATDLDIAAKVEAILKKHGIAVPSKLDQILAIVPFVLPLFKK